MGADICFLCLGCMVGSLGAVVCHRFVGVCGCADCLWMLGVFVLGVVCWIVVEEKVVAVVVVVVGVGVGVGVGVVAAKCSGRVCSWSVVVAVVAVALLDKVVVVGRVLFGVAEPGGCVAEPGGRVVLAVWRVGMFAAAIVEGGEWFFVVVYATGVWVEGFAVIR